MATGKEATWGVCATVNERPEVLEVFAAHYRAIGAAEIFLFFDQPDETLMASLARTGGVTCLASIPLPDVEGKPAPHEDRQKNNFRHALTELARSDWLGHVDADELLVPIGDQPYFAAFLAGIAGNYKSVKIAPAEAVFGPGNTIEQPFGATYARLSTRPKVAERAVPAAVVPEKRKGGLLERLARGFRSQPEPRTKAKRPQAAKPADRQALIRDVYGPLARKFLQNGLSGHFAGKSFVRRGEAFAEMTLHKATPVSGDILQLEGEHFAILHYDALSYDDWRAKWQRRADKRVNMVMMSERRIAMLDEFRTFQGDDKRLRELFEALNVLDDRQLGVLAGAGLAFRIGSFGTAAVRVDPLGEAEFSVPERAADDREQQAKAPSRAWDGQYHRAVENIDPQLIAEMRDSILRSDFATYRRAFARIGVDRFTDRRKLVEPSETTEIDNVLFIAGVHRSGTTLLESLIQERYDVRVLRAPVPENEGQFLQDVMRDEVAYGGPGMFAFFDQSRLEPVADPAAAAGMRARLLRSWDRWTLGQSPVLLEKTPANVVRIPYLRSVFPRARFVVLVRDPRAVVLSVKKWNPSPNELLFMNWCSAYATALKDAADDCLFVRYEDLCDDPARELERIARFAALEKRSALAVQQTRFEEVKNSNDRYISQFPKLPLAMRQRLVFRPWEILGYDLNDSFE
jgi:hypothetical protein